MSGYWIASDLSLMLPQPVQGVPMVSATSRPVNMTGFQSIIDQISAQVDSAIAAAGYGAPIPSGVLAHDYIRFVTTLGSRWRVLIDMGSASAGKHDQEAYYRELDLIREGIVPLVGAPPGGGAGGRVLPRWGGVPSGIFSPTWFA